jgi:glycosyltransferase involved in cell wall biosynthesis/2-polyprenyl-3-methyl-5-hydroxy-6-metoxy-1,4-benzoquinol methylase
VVSQRTIIQIYHSRLRELFAGAIPPGKRVLEVGCGDGHLLASLKPSHGVGIDHDAGAVNRARELYPHLHFHLQRVEALELDETFDYVVMADLLVSVDDVLDVFERLRPLCHAETRWVISSYNAVWQGVISLAERLGLKRVARAANWLGAADILNLLRLADVQPERWQTALALPVPGVEKVMRLFEGLTAPFNWIMFFVAHPQPLPQVPDLPVTVVVPTRNEAGNIRDAVERIPEMGTGTEILFVDGSSTDGTQAEIEAMMKKYPQRKIRLLHQVEGNIPEDAATQRAQRLGKMLPQGKADAVRKGFYAASGEVLMICDADLTVAPEDLPRFYRALATGKADFINGSRMLYPMEEQAMRYINLLGNKFFSLAFSWILGHYVKDTLCGTKVFRKSDFDRIQAFRAEVGDFDPFGDFELLYGASAGGLRIIDLPIRYRRRLYGQPKIENFRHSLLLFKMIWRGVVSLKMGIRDRDATPKGEG